MKKWMINRYNGIVFGRTVLGEYLNSWYSLRLFLKYRFGAAKLSEEANLRAFLIKQYHIVEKGMALPAPRSNFGIPKIRELVAKTHKYERTYGAHQDVSLPVRNALTEYLSRNPDLHEVDGQFYSLITDFIAKTANNEPLGGTKTLLRSELEEATGINYGRFLRSRTSVRDFRLEKIKTSDIVTAIDLARNAPSVCNRQNWKIHYYGEPGIKNKMLEMQHGNGGFTESIQGLLVITTDLKGFTKMEQNQVYVDGGLISMNLVLALHHLGIGSCCLNTCFPYTREIKIKKTGDIPENERLIMMIGIGYWKDEFKVALSRKKEVDDILVIH